MSLTQRNDQVPQEFSLSELLGETEEPTTEQFLDDLLAGPEDDPLVNYRAQRGARELGDQMGGEVSKQFSRAFQRALRESPLGFLGSALPVETIDRFAQAAIRGGAAFSGTVADVIGELPGAESMNGLAAYMRGWTESFRPEDTPHWLIGDIEQAVESAPGTALGVGGALLGGGSVGAAIGGAVGGMGVSYSRSKYQAETQVDEMIAFYEREGFEIPKHLTDDAIENMAMYMALIEGGIEGVGAGVSFGIGAGLAKLATKRASRKLARSAAEKFLGASVVKGAKGAGMFAGEAVLEGLEEVVTEVGQSFVQIDPVQRDVTWTELGLAFRGGMVGGATMSTPMLAVGAIAEKKKQEAQEKALRELNQVLVEAAGPASRQVARYENEFDGKTEEEQQNRIERATEARMNLIGQREGFKSMTESELLETDADGVTNADKQHNLTRQISELQDAIEAMHVAKANLKDGVRTEVIEAQDPTEYIKQNGYKEVSEPSEKVGDAANRLRELGVDVRVVDTGKEGAAFYDPQTPTTIYLNDNASVTADSFAEGLHELDHLLDHLAPEQAAEIRDILTLTRRMEYAKEYTTGPGADTKQDRAARARQQAQSQLQRGRGIKTDDEGIANLRGGETFSEVEGTASAVGRGAEILSPADKSRFARAIDAVAARVGFLGQEAKAAQRILDTIKSTLESLPTIKPGDQVEIRGKGAELIQRTRMLPDPTPLRSRRTAETVSEASQARMDRPGGIGDVQALSSRAAADTSSPEFKQFFGSSQVVDEDGEPLVVYHGSTEYFDTFNYDKLGQQGTSEGRGLYFTSNRDVGVAYQTRGEDGPGILFEGYLNIEKPLSEDSKTITKDELEQFIRAIDPDGSEYLTNYGDVSFDGYDSVVAKAVEAEYDFSENDVDLINAIMSAGVPDEMEFFRTLKSTLGYDGIITAWGDKEDGGVPIYIAFLPEQAKSVESKAFDTTKPSFLESRRNTRADRGRLLRAENETESLESRRQNPVVQEQAEQYARSKRLPYDPNKASGYADLDIDRAKRIADAFDALPIMDLANPETREAYRSLADETIEQFEFVQQQGVQFIPWAGKGEPYVNSSQMMQDVEQNQRLYYFKTINPEDPATFGESVEGYIAQGHPLFEEYGDPVADSNGDLHQQNVNDLFRAVHDYFGHAKEGFQFGPRGEENAWRVHSQMYSPSARRAMTTETRGQNSWVNFNENMRREDGSIPVRGDQDYIPLPERDYADQKVALLPEEFAMLDEEVASGVTALGSRRRNSKAEVEQVLEAVPAKTARTVLAKSDMVNWMTPEDALGFTRSDVANEAIAKYDEFVSDRRLLADALQILPAASEWYMLSEQVFSSLGEGRIPLWKLVAVIATTSAQKSVKSNVDVGLRTALAYTEFIEKGGDPSNTESLLRAIAGKNASRGPKGRMKKILSTGTGPLYLYADVLGTADVLQSQTMDEVVQRLITPGSMIKQQLDLDKGTGAARKLAAFLRNLMGDDRLVTNDVWMAFWWGVDQQNFSSGSGYAAATAAMRNIASAVGMSPAQGQAAAWAIARVYLGRVRNEKKRAPANRRKFTDVIAEPVTIEDLLGTDIGSLLVLPTLPSGGKEVANEAPDLLRSLGFNPDAARDIVGDFEQRYREAYSGVDFSLPGSLGPRRSSRLVRRFEQADIDRNIKKNVKRAEEGKPPLPTTRLASRQGVFDSKMYRSLNDARDQPNIKTSEQLRAFLGKQGVEREEIYWTGLDEFLKSQDPKATVDINEAIAHGTTPVEVLTSIGGVDVQGTQDPYTRTFSDPAEFSEYLPAGHGTPLNLLLTINPSDEALQPSVFNPDTKEFVKTDYTPHFGNVSHVFNLGDEANVITHVRATDQSYQDDGDVFHVQEIQSDWATYVRDLTDGDVDIEGGVEVAPFIFSKRKGKVVPLWQKLALKRSLAYAVENNYRYISIANTKLVNSVEGIRVAGKGYDALPKMMETVLARYEPGTTGNLVDAESLGFNQQVVDEQIDAENEVLAGQDASDYVYELVSTIIPSMTLADGMPLILRLQNVLLQDNEFNDSAITEASLEEAGVRLGDMYFDGNLERGLEGSGTNASALHDVWYAMTQDVEAIRATESLGIDLAYEVHPLLSSGEGGYEVIRYDREGSPIQVGEAPTRRDAQRLLAYSQLKALYERTLELAAARRENPLEQTIGFVHGEGYVEQKLFGGIDMLMMPFDTREVNGGLAPLVFGGDLAAAKESLQQVYNDFSFESALYDEYLEGRAEESRMNKPSPMKAGAGATVYDLGLSSEPGTLANKIQEELDTVGMPLFSRRGGLAGEQVVASPDPRTSTPEFQRFYEGTHPYLYDDQGEPLVLYHGTMTDPKDPDTGADMEGEFDRFVINRGRANKYGDGIYATADPDFAGSYAMATASRMFSDSDLEGADGARILPLYFALKRPYVIESLSGESDIDPDRDLRSEGYDGVIRMGRWFGQDYVKEAVAFEPGQVKSALSNRGTFDRSQDSMLESRSYRRDAEDEFFSDRKGQRGNRELRKSFRAGYAYSNEEAKMIREEEREAQNDRLREKVANERMLAADKLIRLKNRFDRFKERETNRRLVERMKNRTREQRLKLVQEANKERQKEKDNLAKSIRKSALEVVRLLPEKYKGKIAAQLAKTDNPKKLAALSRRAIRLSAHATYGNTRTRFGKAKKMLGKRKMSNQTKKTVMAALDQAEIALRPGGSLLTTTAKTEQSLAASDAANKLIDQALDAYRMERDDFRSQKDARSERLLDAAIAIEEGFTGRRRAKRKQKGVTSSPFREGVVRAIIRMGGDMESLIETIDESGVFSEYLVARMRRAESDYYTVRREIMEELDLAAQRAGFASGDALLAATSDSHLGIESTQKRDIIVNGKKVTVRLGELMKLAALDDESLNIILDTTDDDGNEVRGVGIAFRDAGDDVAYQMTADEYAAILATLTPEEAALVQELKDAREKLRDPAFDVFYQLHGYQPRFVPGYEPRSRRATASMEPPDVQTSGVGASFLDTGGFTKERVEGGGSPVLIGDFLSDWMNSTDALARLSTMAMPVRDAYALLMDERLSKEIVTRYGQGALDRIRDLFISGSGLQPRAELGVFAKFLQDMASALSVAYLSLNPGTFTRVAAGGVARMISDPDMPIVGLSQAIATPTSWPKFDDIAEISGYFYARNREAAIDRRTNQQMQTLEGERRRMAMEHLKAAMRETAAGRLLIARRQLIDAFGQIGILDLIDRTLVRVAVAAHMKGGATFEQAVDRAETTIRRTQNTTSTLDDPAILGAGRTGSVARIFLPFASDPMKAGARLHQAVGSGDMAGVGRWVGSTLANATVNVTTRPITYLIAYAVSEFLDDEEESLVSQARIYDQWSAETMGIDAISETIGSAGGIGGYLVAGPIADMVMRYTAGRTIYADSATPQPLGIDAIAQFAQTATYALQSTKPETRNRHLKALANQALKVAIGDPTQAIRKSLGALDPIDTGEVDRAIRLLKKLQKSGDDSDRLDELIRRLEAAKEGRE